MLSSDASIYSIGEFFFLALTNRDNRPAFKDTQVPDENFDRKMMLKKSFVDVFIVYGKFY